MKAGELIKALSRKLKSTSKAELASALGVTQMTLYNWEKRNEDLRASQVAEAIAKSRNAAVQQSQLKMIQPIVELFPLECCRSKRDAIWHMFESGKSAPLYLQGLKGALEQSVGIYIFYDSRGQALYVGKTDRLTLWGEMTNSFNRPRKVQSIFLVNHPQNHEKFLPGHEKLRQPRQTAVHLYELASYFSAYEVAEGMVGDLEALLVRSFSNTLLNVKMETFANNRRPHHT